MSTKRVSPKLPSPADIVGLPALQLANMLDDILAERRGPAPAGDTATGLLGLAETLRASLALPPQADGPEPAPTAGAEDLLPELRIVESVLANIPREHRPAPAPTRRDDEFAALAPPPRSEAEQHGIAVLPQATADHDLEAIRQALRPFAGQTLPDSVFHEVMALTAALSGRTYQPPAATVDAISADDGRGDRLLVEAEEIHNALNDLGPPRPAEQPPSAAAEPVDAAVPAPPVTVRMGAPRRTAPRRAAPHRDEAPSPPVEIAARPTTPPAPPEAAPRRRPRAAKGRPNEAVVPAIATAPAAPPEMAAPEPLAEPATDEAAKPLKVKVKPSRRRKSAPPPPATAPEPAPQPAGEPLAEPAPAAEAVTGPDAPPAPRLQPAPLPEPIPEPAAKAVPEPAEDEDVLLLTDEVPAFTEDEAPVEMTAGEAAVAAPVPPSPVEDATPPPEPAAMAGDGVLATLIEAIIAAHVPAEAAPRPTRGDPTLPENTEALAALLADPPPATDFAALDLLNACWGKGAHEVASRAMLAAAQNLSRNFGLPGKLPMASCRAWKMLDAATFQDELADRLEAVGAFIANWQRSQRTFLILEFGEIELVEYLFEALHPADHLDLLANVMNFKVLSNRRLGLLRRIPTRLRKQVQPMLPARHHEALVLLAHTKALLERVADPSGFAPIVDAAGKALEEIDKLMKQAAAAGAPPLPGPPGGGGGGMALGRIGG